MPGTKVAERERREQIVRAAYDVATGEGLRSITIRSVAMEAEISPGLVLFHFESKENLIQAVADWVISTTTVLHVGPDILAIEDPLERLLTLLRQEMRRLTSEPKRIRVFFELWNAGLRDRRLGGPIQQELARYRQAFRPMVEEALAADPERFGGVTVDALTAVAVSFIKGAAVQSMIEPRLDIAAYVGASEALLAPELAMPAFVAGRRGKSRALNV
jgi:TetR/AcrR family transcriptional regulator, transcriptional repressor of bet genes